LLESSILLDTGLWFGKELLKRCLHLMHIDINRSWPLIIRELGGVNPILKITAFQINLLL
jgi:hypothetical protein